LQHERTSYISVYRLKSLLKWTETEHELVELNNYLNEMFNNSCLKSLIELLNDKTNENLAENFSYFNLNKFQFDELPNDDDECHGFDQLEFYFAKRPAYVIDEVNCYTDIARYENEWFDENFDYNLKQQQNDADDEVDVDLNGFFSGSFDVNDQLAKELSNLLAKKSNFEKNVGKHKRKRFKKSEIINTRTGFRYKAPMRGGHNHQSRGCMRFSPSFDNFSLNAFVTNRHDPFRSRQPNTSRPPSVHVDDFYRLQQNHNATKVPQQQEPDLHDSNRLNRVRIFLYLALWHFKLKLCIVCFPPRMMPTDDSSINSCKTAI
jgi:hypothetical protein